MKWNHYHILQCFISRTTNQYKTSCFQYLTFQVNYAWKFYNLLLNLWKEFSKRKLVLKKQNKWRYELINAVTRHKVNRFTEDLEKLFLLSFRHDCLLYLQQKYDCFLHKERQFQKTWLNKRVTEIAGMYFLQFRKSFCILWDPC